MRVSSLLRDGHRNERHTTSALPPDPLTRSSKPFRVVKIVCRVLVVRRLCRRRGGAHHHHSRRGGKHDFNEGERVLSFSREEYAFQAGVLSRLSRGSHETRKQSVRKGGAKFFVFWLPRFNTKFSPKFLDKKSF